LKRYGNFEVFDDLVNAKQFADHEVSIPIHPFLSEWEVDRVIESINRWKS